MKRVIFLEILITVTLTSGCEERDLQKVDRFVQDVNTVKAGAKAVLKSPAGAALPLDWKVYGSLGCLFASIVVNGWQEWRNNTMKKTTKAIVKGIENTTNPDKATSEVKENIAREMIKAGGEKFYSKANKIVDRLKMS